MGLARAHPVEARRQHHPAGSILELTGERVKEDGEHGICAKCCLRKI